MSKVIFDISLSLDGYITAANQTPDEPMGDGGQRLHEWAFGDDERDRAILTEGMASIGAVIAGRRTYDDSVPWWGPDGPTGPRRLPVVVVSHSVPDETPADGVYSFATDGIEAALEQARAAAGDKDVTVMGGARTGKQYLAAGLVDELSLHVVPVLFGSGTRMFEHLAAGHVQLEPVEVIQTPAAIHQRFRLLGRAADASARLDTLAR